MGRSILVAALATATLAFAGAAGSGTVSVGVSSLAIRSKSVTLSWQASAPVRAVVEYGTTDEYGIWTKATDPGSSGRITLPALEPRTEYRYRMLALDTAGAQAVTAGAFRTQAIPPRSAATTTPESLLVNGQPLFPRMVFRTCSYYYASALTAGVNVFMGSGCVEPGGQLGLLGNRAYSLLTLRQRGSTGRGLIGWYHQDEPDGHGRTTLPTLPPSSLTERVSFLTLTDHFSTRSAPLPIGTAVYHG